MRSLFLIVIDEQILLNHLWLPAFGTKPDHQYHAQNTYHSTAKMNARRAFGFPLQMVEQRILDHSRG